MAMRPTVEETIGVLRRFTRCPLYAHDYPETPRRRRIDCADDQCMNRDCIRYVECDMPQHDAAELVARYDESLIGQPATEQADIINKTGA